MKKSFIAIALYNLINIATADLQTGVFVGQGLLNAQDTKACVLGIKNVAGTISILASADNNHVFSASFQKDTDGFKAVKTKKLSSGTLSMHDNILVANAHVFYLKTGAVPVLFEQILEVEFDQEGFPIRYAASGDGNLVSC